MRESVLERKICDYARSIGYITYKFTSPGNRGVPDRVFIFGGKVIFMEIKAPGKLPTPLQLREINAINAQAGHACWHNTFEGAKEILDTLAR